MIQHLIVKVTYHMRRFVSSVSLIAIGVSVAAIGAGLSRPASAVTASAKMSNPLTETWTTADGVPPYDRIKPSHFLPAFDTGLAQAKADIARIANNRTAPTFENTIEALERSGRLLSRVPSAQPLGLLAAAMLEAESPDSFLAWNFYPGMLQRTEYIEGYAIEPMAAAMLARDPALNAAFEKRLTDDKAFADNPLARLQWFYERSPYYDQRFLLYPVGRELADTTQPQ